MSDNEIDFTDPKNDVWHSAEYRSALNTLSEDQRVDQPTWDELPDDKKANIRRINHEHRAFMNDLAHSIHTGAPLPPLPGYPNKPKEN